MIASLPARPFGAFLFDMDGTILSSIKAAERVWADWARAHELDVATFLPTIHGVQSVETIRRLDLPGIDPVSEAVRITQAEIEDVEGIEAIAGVGDFVAGLPAERWAIVTSAPRALALRRIEAAGLPLPPVVITAEDVEHGKPAPDCFLLAAKRLGQEARSCLVFEDSPAGIAAAEAAAMEAIVVTATHNAPFPRPLAQVPDYRGLRVARQDDGLLRVEALS